MDAPKEGWLLAGMTTFGIGGAAEFFVRAERSEDIEEAIAWAKKKGVAVTLLAGGSNVLVADEGVRGLVVHIDLRRTVYEGDEVTAEAGVSMLDLIRDAASRNLGGWEKMAGIPGTVGGAVRGNAGAFGAEITDFAQSVRALNRVTLEYKDFSAPECAFSYRRSFFKDNPEWIVIAARFRLSPISKEESEHRIAETIAEREKRHLQNVRAAGSYFMNPVVSLAVQQQFETEKKAAAREGRVPAGWLIEKAGMKGARVGGAEASTQHPNYLVNREGATAKDVRQLADKIKQAVREQFGVELREEAQYLS